MPRNVSGVYSKPSGTTAVSGEVIASATYNLLINDLVADLNTPRPVEAGGTGASDPATARANLGLALGADVQAQSAFLQAVADLFRTGQEGKLLGLNGADPNVPEYFTPANIVDPVAADDLSFLQRDQVNDRYIHISLIADQATWNVGAGTAIKAISPAQLNAKLANFEQQLGVGQTWQDVVGSRSPATIYQNTTDKPIAVSIRANGNSQSVQVSTDSTTWINVGRVGDSSGMQSYFVVPDQHYYRINGSTTVTRWAELREST
ncbi:MAG: hypothetical protein AAFR98_11855 [Pseudomonadota bacterium]